MEQRSKRQICRMAYNLFEVEHRSRTRHGWHIYLSRFMIDFKKLDKMDQLTRIKGREWRAAAEADELENSDDEDSTDTPIKEEPIPAGAKIRLASVHWHSLPDIIRGAWKIRAAKLNLRKLPGSFDVIPVQFRDHDFIKEALKSLTNEWVNIAFNFQRSIVNDPRRELSSMSYLFGKERVPLLSQTYRTIHMTDLLRSSIWKRTNAFKYDEKISESNRILLVHIASQDRMSQVMTHNMLCAAKIQKGNRTHSCAGKVFLRRRGLELRGYIKSEYASTWVVHLTNDLVVHVNKVYMNAQKTRYEYPVGNSRKYCVFEYCPIRFLIRADGTVRYTLSRFTTEKIKGRERLVTQYSG